MTRMRVMAGAAVVMLATLPVMAQSAPPPCEAWAGMLLLSPSVIRDLPYSATYKLTTDQTLADGTKIHRESTSRAARDMDGRSLTQIIIFCSPGRRGQSDPHPIYQNNVVDPQVGEFRNWQSGIVDGDSMSRTVDIRELPAKYKAEDSAEMRSRLDGVEKFPDTARMKKLGHQTIAGLDAIGELRTSITPAGSMGNDRPIVRTKEIWTSTELGIVVREIDNDPSAGRSSLELQDISQAQPDEALFAAPADYPVKRAGNGQ